MAENKYGIELISGITPKNGGDFPLVQSKDVAITKNKRLSDYLIKELFPTKTLSFALDETEDSLIPYAYTTSAEEDFDITPGETYIVDWNGKEYEKRQKRTG